MTNRRDVSISLCVPGSLAYRDIAVRAVSGACKLASASLGWQEGEGHQLVSAFGEAFNNAVQHGYGGGREPGRIRVEVEWDEETIEVRVIDNGSSFDPAEVPAPDLSALPESGMGLFIIRSFVDRVDYAPGPPNVLSMTKLLRRP